MPAFIGRQNAVVIHEVTPNEEPDEPVIRLDDGQEVRPIWCDRYVPLGTKGTAEFVVERNAWRFYAEE